MPTDDSNPWDPGATSGDDAPPAPDDDSSTDAEAGVADEAAVYQPEGDGEDAESSSPDEDLLDLRDATTDEVERQLARRLKRVLSDEQNELLDTLRRTKGAPDSELVLPAEADHLERYQAAAQEDLAAAERAGAGFYGDPPARVAVVDDISLEFATSLVGQVRGRLLRAFEDDAAEDEVADAIRSIYREWKTQRIAEAARHYVVTAFSRGLVEAAPDGASFRWLVDHGGAAAPDCEDNALAGAVPRGEAFPTGDLCPPVHASCRCLIVPVDL